MPATGPRFRCEICCVARRVDGSPPCGPMSVPMSRWAAPSDFQTSPETFAACKPCLISVTAPTSSTWQSRPVAPSPKISTGRSRLSQPSPTTSTDGCGASGVQPSRVWREEEIRTGGRIGAFSADCGDSLLQKCAQKWRNSPKPGPPNRGGEGSSTTPQPGRCRAAGRGRRRLAWAPKTHRQASIAAA